MIARMRHPSARANCRHNDAALVARRRDPTRTGDIRRRYTTQAESRWRAVRSATQSAISAQDMLGLSTHEASAMALSITMAASGAQPTGVLGSLPGAGKIQAFQTWFDQLLLRQITATEGSWLMPMIGAAYDRAVDRAKKLSKSDAQPANRDEQVQAIGQLAFIELQGIAEATSQRAVREVSLGIMHNSKPTVLARALTDAIQAVGVIRTRAMLDMMVSKAYSMGTLDQFAAAGVQKVGLVPEYKPTPKLRKDHLQDAPSTFKGTGPGSLTTAEVVPSARTVRRISAAQRTLEAIFGIGGPDVNVETAGDELVCPECLDIEDGNPYTLNEARSLIPAHPWCRCAFVPADDGLPIDEGG